MRERPAGRERREPSAEKHNRAEARHGDHAGVFGDEKHRELEAGVLRVKTGDELGFRFGKIERHAVGFRYRRDEKAEESQNLRPDVPAQDAALGMVGLRINDVAQVKTAREKQHADDRHRERKLVAHHLRRTAQAAEQRILAVRRPSGQCDAVNAQSGYRKQRENADVQVRDPEVDLLAPNGPRQRIGTKRDNGDRRQRERQRHQRRKKISKFVHARWRRIFLQKKFCAIRQRLQQSMRPDTMRSPSRLHVRHNFALEPRQIRIDRQNDEKQKRNLYKTI